MKIALTIAVTAVLGLCATAAHARDLAPAVQRRVAAFEQLLGEQWQHQLQASPEVATALGDLHYNDQWSDGSPATMQRERTLTKDFIKRFGAIDVGGFPDEEKLDHQLIVRQLQDTLRGIDLKLYEMPLNPFNGVQVQLPYYISLMPFAEVKHYEDYLQRLKNLPKALQQSTEAAQQGLRDGLLPPRFLLEKVVTQIDDMTKRAGADNAFAEPLKHFPDSVPEAERTRLRAAIIAAIDDDVRPAYRRLGEFVAKDYAPRGRSEPGIWQLPNGAAIYRYCAEHMTTTQLAPDRIHAIGLAEVQRIETEMTAIAKAQGYTDLASFRAALKKDPKLHPTSPEDLLDRYRGFVAGMQPQLPTLFHRLPKAGLVVVPVEAFREASAPLADYHPGTPDGSRSGQLFVNTGNFAARTTLVAESVSYHEGIPGHHLQLSIAQELTTLPPFRQQADYTAYVEGWALYAERLGKEIGFYKDPLSDYGRLSSELWRADRLVLDTGVHDKRWTRQQMVDFFRAHSSLDEPDIESEVDRYIGWPGQALAYTIGQRKMLELRERARKALGSAFDIRAFHDALLGDGALPLDILDTRIEAWIHTQASAKTL